MSMNTIYVLISRDNRVIEIAPQLGPQEALEHLTYAAQHFGGGKVYACRISDTAAFDVREAFHKPGKDRASPLTLLKLYSTHMNHVSDVT